MSLAGKRPQMSRQPDLLFGVRGEAPRAERSVEAQAAMHVNERSGTGLNSPNCRMRVRLPGGVAGAPGLTWGPYADCHSPAGTFQNRGEATLPGAIQPASTDRCAVIPAVMPVIDSLAYALVVRQA